MKGLKCSGCKGCKWLLPNSFCGYPNNTKISNDCYESEENSNASSKIEAVKQEINDYVNSKSKEEIETEVNETESVFEKLQKYLENATQEQLDKDWEELKQYNEVGPVIIDSCEAGYKWHEIADGDLPKEEGDYLLVMKTKYATKEGTSKPYMNVSYFSMKDGWKDPYGEEFAKETVFVAWMELPEYAEK